MTYPYQCWHFGQNKLTLKTFPLVLPIFLQSTSCHCLDTSIQSTGVNDSLLSEYLSIKWLLFSLKWILFSLKWIPFSLSQVNADIPAIEKAIQASGSKVRTHSLFLIPFLKRLTTLIHVKRQSYIILISPPLACLKNLLCQVKMSGEDLKACVLEIQEVLVAWTVSCLVILPEPFLSDTQLLFILRQKYTDSENVLSGDQIGGGMFKHVHTAPQQCQPDRPVTLGVLLDYS